MSQPDSPKGAKSILMIAANPATSAQTGWPIGFWAAELVHPWLEFQEAGYEVTIASPEGGRLEVDAFSDPRHESGYSVHDILSLGFLSSPSHQALLEDTPSIADISISEYDAIFLVGGQSPIYTFLENNLLHRVVLGAWEQGKIVAAVCHATCIFLKLKTGDGRLLVTDRTWTGFADAEERFADEAVGQKIQPFWIESEARKIEGTNFVVNRPFKPFAVRDGNLITGQQQNSGKAAALRVIEALGK